MAGFIALSLWLSDFKQLRPQEEAQSKKKEHAASVGMDESMETLVELVRVAPKRKSNNVKKRKTPPTQARRVQKKSNQTIKSTEIGIDEKLIQTGSDLLKLKGKEKFPAIRSDYRSMGLRDYMIALTLHGGRFFIGDTRSRKLKTSIDPYLEVLDNGINSFDESLYAMDRQRILEDEAQSPPISRYLNLANQSFGCGEYYIVLLLEKWFDALVVGGIADYLNDIDRSRYDFKEFQASYKYNKDQELILWIHTGALVKGGQVSLELTINFNRKDKQRRSARSRELLQNNKLRSENRTTDAIPMRNV